jgi:hypothetical protein
VDIGVGSIQQPTYVNANLTRTQKEKVCEMLMEFTNCFAWSYTKMPGLGKGLVEY